MGPLSLSRHGFDRGIYFKACSLYGPRVQAMARQIS